MRRPALTTFSIALAGALFAASVLCYAHLASIRAVANTRLTPGFSDFHFQSLLPGTTRAAVREKFGEPFAIRHLPHRDIFVYAPPHYVGTPVNVFMPRPTRRERFVSLLFVYFDQDGRVAGTFGAIAEPLASLEAVARRPFISPLAPPPPGLTKSQVRYGWGMPTFIHSHPAQTVEDYAVPTGPPPFKVRRLYFAGDNLLDVEWHTRLLHGIRHVTPERGRR